MSHVNSWLNLNYEEQLETVRSEADNLKAIYLAKEQLLQGELGELKNALEEELNNLTEETYQESLEEHTNCVSYDIYKERVEKLIHMILTIKSNLTCYKIDFENLDDHDNVNFAKSILYRIRGSLDYISDVYEVYGEYFEEL